MIAVAVGTVPGWLTFAAIIGAAWMFMRGGGGTAINSLEAANRVLEKTVHDQGTQINELKRDLKVATETIADLRVRTDFSTVIHPLVEAVTTHEGQARERFEKTLTVLDLMMKKFGDE